MRVVIAGDPALAEQVETGLSAFGADVQVVEPPLRGSGPALVASEEALESAEAGAAVALGPGSAALALAVTASKLGVPLATVLAEESGDDAEAGPRRILSALSDHEATADDPEAVAAIAAWANLE